MPYWGVLALWQACGAGVASCGMISVISVETVVSKLAAAVVPLLLCLCHVLHPLPKHRPHMPEHQTLPAVLRKWRVTRAICIYTYTHEYVYV